MWVGARPNDYPVVTVMTGWISVEELPDVEVELERNQFRTPTCAPREAVGGVTPAICEAPGLGGRLQRTAGGRAQDRGVRPCSIKDQGCFRGKASYRGSSRLAAWNVCVAMVCVC